MFVASIVDASGAQMYFVFEVTEQRDNLMYFFKDDNLVGLVNIENISMMQFLEAPDSTEATLH